VNSRDGGNITPFPDRYNPSRQSPPQPRQQAGRPLVPFYPATFEGTEAPPLRWVVPNLIPRGYATLLTGNYNLGKSFIILDLLVAAALGQEWLGNEVAMSNVFGLFCEDPKDRLHWRLAQVLRHHNASYADLETRFSWDARFGEYSALMQFHRFTEQGRTTPLWDQLWHLTVQQLGSQIIFIDTARQTFKGEENSSLQVTEFLNNLNKLAAAIDGAVIISHHPPKNGTSEYAGSGAWAGTARNHLYLTRSKEWDPETREGWDKRVLRQMNGNYSSENEPALNLRWDAPANMFLLDDTQPAAVSGSTNLDMFGRMDLDLRIMAAVRSLILDGSLPHAARERQQNIVRLLRGLPGFRSTAEAQLWAGVDRLIEKNELLRIEYGAAGNRRILLRPADLRFPGEGA
jgi:hypothetical protein